MAAEVRTRRFRLAVAARRGSDTEKEKGGTAVAAMATAEREGQERREEEREGTAVASEIGPHPSMTLCDCA